MENCTKDEEDDIRVIDTGTSGCVSDVRVVSGGMEVREVEEGRRVEDRLSMSEGMENVREEESCVGMGVILISITVLVSMIMKSLDSKDSISEVLVITVTKSSSSSIVDSNMSMGMYVCGEEGVTSVRGGGGK